MHPYDRTEDGSLFYCFPNMTDTVPHTSTYTVARADASPPTVDVRLP